MAEKKNGNYYVSNQELLEEIMLYKKTGVFSNRLGKMLMDIAKHYSGHGSFANYTWRQDMISNALCTCLQYIKNFNPEKSTNAFSYVTQIIGNAFKYTIIKEKRVSKIKDICYKSTIFADNKEDTGYTQQAINYETILHRVPKYMHDEEVKISNKKTPDINYDEEV